MAIDKKLIKYATKARFTADLGNSLIPTTSIVFIQDTGELWTHGIFFGGHFSSVDSNYGTLTLDGSSVNLSLYGHKHNYTDLLGSTTTANQAIVSNGTANGWTLKTLGSGAFDSTSYLPLSGGTLTGVLQLSNSGLKFADNAFGGGGDIAKMYLATKGGEATTMTFEVGNDSDDTINFITPSSTGLTHNSNIILDSLNYSNYAATKDYVTTAVNGIQVGGTNLLLNSKISKSGTGYNIGFWTSSRDFIVGETLTVTIKGTISTSKLFGIWFNAGSFGGYPIQRVSEGIFSASFYVPIGTSNRTVGIYLINNDSAGDSWTFEWIKLESGNKATDWSPAPEDVTNAISTAQSAAATDATNKVNAVQIGGLNLAQGTSQFTGGNIAPNHSGYGDSVSSETFRGNKVYKVTSDWHGFIFPTLAETIQPTIISFYAKIDSGTTARFTSPAGGNNHQNYTASDSGYINSTTWKQYYIYFPNGCKFYDNNSTVGIVEFYQTTGCYYTSVKVELGTKPTDWTPAPEDVDASIQLAQSTAISTAETDAATKYLPINGNAATSTVASKLGQNGISGVPMIFNWSGQSGQPSWLWGGNDGTNMYVYNPSNFNVASATKLQTARKLWGNDFLGDSDVNGKIHSSASSINIDLTRIPSDNEIAIETGNGDGTVSSWIWREKYSSSNWGIFHNNANDYIHFVGNSVSRLSVALNTGYVGINTLSPSYNLHVSGTGYFSSSLDVGDYIHAGTHIQAPMIGVTNTSPTNGYGLSLYNGAVNGMPTYGIAFAGTSTFGTHGGVTSDWATYLTMSDTTNRGWIFKRGNTNVASIDGVGTITASNFNGNLNGTAVLSSLTMNGSVGFNNITTGTRGLNSIIGDNDGWYIQGESTATNSGSLRLGTWDDGTEPIMVSQGPSNMSFTRTAYLLDSSGNTSFPGSVTAPSFNGSLYGNATTSNYPNGFTGSVTSWSWGHITTANGYVQQVSWDYNGADIAFGSVSSSGQLSVQIDGFFYQDEGQYRVLDTNSYTAYALPLTGGAMTGDLHIGNTTIYAGGTNGSINSIAPADDVILGDCNIGGHLGLKSLNTNNCGIGFYNLSGGYLGRLTINSSGTPTWVDNTIWHAGNDGSGSGLDADLLDGLHLADVYVHNINLGTYTPTNSTVAGHKEGLVNYWSSIGTGVGGNVDISNSIIANWDTDSDTYYNSSAWGMIKIGGSYSGTTYGQWLLSSYSDLNLKVVGRSNNAWTSIKTIAYTSDNVASATKLQTARSIWGQTFDGSGDINGTVFTNIGLKSRSICIETDSDGNASSEYAEINNWKDNLFLQHTSSKNLLCCTGGGYVGIGTTSPAYKLDVSGDIRSTGSIYGALNTSSPIVSSYQSASWINGVSNACLSCQYPSSGSYGAIFNAPVSGGRISLSTYPASDNNLYFGYATAAQISAGTNALNSAIVFAMDTSTITANTFSGNLNGSATNLNNSGTVTLATAVEENRIDITQPSYTTESPVKLLNFHWYNDMFSIGAIRSGDTPIYGLGIYKNGSQIAYWDASGSYHQTDGNGYIQGYLNSASGGGEKNASSPPYVWGTNGTDNFLRTYETSCLSVAYAANAGAIGGYTTANIMFKAGGTFSGDVNFGTSSYHINTSGSATFGNTYCSYLSCSGDMFVNNSITTNGICRDVTVIRGNVTLSPFFHIIYTNNINIEITIYLPSSPADGQEFIIKKYSGAKNITIHGNGHNLWWARNNSASLYVQDERTYTVVYSSSLAKWGMTISDY